MTPYLKLTSPGKLILALPQITSPLGIIGWLSVVAAALSLAIAAAFSTLICVFVN